MYQSTAHMFPISSGDKTLPTHSHPASHVVDRYTEQEIQQVARGLVKDGRQSWSENPRLYIILRDIGQIKDTSQTQLIDVLIKNGLSDFWIPITSESILQQIFKTELHSQFLQVQGRVCLQSRSFRVGFRNSHGNFATKDEAPFECRRSMGRGRLGHVEEVFCLTDKKVYARKSIRKVSYFRDARNDVERFRCELQALRRIKHRHCVQIAVPQKELDEHTYRPDTRVVLRPYLGRQVGSYTNPRHLVIIMLPVADSNLQEFLQLAEISSEPYYALQIREWFGCLATAVQYLHTNHIRHRDIKPANILVHGANILLVDFELALDWKDLAQSTTTANCGRTPLYAAPEVIELKKCNSTSDIWSLGCVFLEMATVLKQKSISQLRQHFVAQTDSALFFNNPQSIRDWISLLRNSSTFDNAPLLWISKMLHPDRNLRSRAAAIIDNICDSRTDTSRPNPYFGKCCQRGDQTSELETPKCLCCGTETQKNSSGLLILCTECTMTHQSRIYRNPEVSMGILPVNPLISYLHPPFMIKHLTQHSMKEFTRSVVADDRWEPFDVDVQLLCLPGQPLYLNVRRFMHSYHLYSLQTQSNSQATAILYSLPIGIYEPAQEATVKKFNAYLDEIFNNNLMKYAIFMQELRGFDHSSRTLGALFEWFEQWKDELPSHELLLMRNAMKLIAIQTILGLGLILETVPPAFTHSPFHSLAGPQPPNPQNQTPRLLNRQVKVAFFTIYKTLLPQVLTGFRQPALRKESWIPSMFVGMCLAFLLERIEAGSQEFLLFAKSIYKDEEGSIRELEGYFGEVNVVVFDRIYRVLGVVVQRRSDGGGATTMKLLGALRRLRKEFDDEGCERSPLDVRVRHSSRFVSALLDLGLRT